MMRNTSVNFTGNFIDIERFKDIKNGPVQSHIGCYGYVVVWKDQKR